MPLNFRRPAEVHYRVCYCKGVSRGRKGESAAAMSDAESKGASLMRLLEPLTLEPGEWGWRS